MGADFLIYRVRVEVSKEQALAALEALSDEALFQRLEDVDSLSVWDLEAEDETFDGSMAEIRQQLRDALDDVYDGDRRDWTVIEIDGVDELVSGGMSWGDTPTEACDIIQLLDESGVLRRPAVTDTQQIYYDPDDADADGLGWNVVGDSDSVAARFGTAIEAVEFCNAKGFLYLFRDAQVTDRVLWRQAMEVLVDAFCDGSWTCDEAEALFMLLNSLHLHDDADRVMRAHASTDEEGDQHAVSDDGRGWERLEGRASWRED